MKQPLFFKEVNELLGSPCRFNEFESLLENIQMLIAERDDTLRTLRVQHNIEIRYIKEWRELCNNLGFPRVQGLSDVLEAVDTLRTERDTLRTERARILDSLVGEHEGCDLDTNYICNTIEGFHGRLDELLDPCPMCNTIRTTLR